MNYLAENSAPVWALGGVLFTMAVIAYSFTRSKAAAAAVLLVVLLTGAGLAAERWVVTPREQVEQALQTLLARVEADDLPGVLALVSQDAGNLRSDAQALMPEFDIHKARSTGEVEVLFEDPQTALVEFRFFASGRHKRSGHKVGDWTTAFLSFKKQTDRWVVTSYSTEKNWRNDAARL